VAEIIRREAPDVLAIQEGLAFQLDELDPVLAGYRKLGQHRDGGTDGEFSGLYVRTDRVRLVDWGEFWLSPTPDVVASRGWDAALPRMAVWADVVPDGGDTVVRVYGTHFDHRGEVARVESARLIAEQALAAGRPTVVMGDLNVPDGSEAVRTFADLGYRSAVVTLHPDETLGTFNGFTDPRGGEQRIDHVLVGPGLRPTAAAILDDRVDGLFPSDHFPVVAVVVVAGSRH
jgi:endonuclease/exonuclease/phosphatase family metal-dependent hydrolase